MPARVAGIRIFLAMPQQQDPDRSDNLAMTPEQPTHRNLLRYRAR
jgi:hypothetical protein